MCGIIGYAGHRPAVPILLEGLKRLEYRGYDSAGVAYIMGRDLEIMRAEGKLCQLEDKIAGHDVSMPTTGIGHTRWATHGVPVERNAHPHKDNSGRLAMIHNGIIENFQEQKDWLIAKGYTFASETDTEVLVNLISEGLKETGGDVLKALSWALNRVEGAYAVALVSLDEPGVVYAARQSSPLVFGAGTGENFVASDIPAFLAYTREVVFLEDGELVRLDANSWQVYDALTLAPLEKAVSHIDWDVQSAQKGGHKHFMIKEIFEQPKVIADCLAGRVDTDRGVVNLPELEGMAPPKRLHIVACGTSYHAGLWGMNLIESWARIPVRVEIASEFRYRDLLLDEDDVILAISQSGETADTLAGIRRAKELGAKVIGLCNVVGSQRCARVGPRGLHPGRARDQRGLHQGHVQPAHGAVSSGLPLGRGQGHPQRGDRRARRGRHPRPSRRARGAAARHARAGQDPGAQVLGREEFHVPGAGAELPLGPGRRA